VRRFVEKLTAAGESAATIKRLELTISQSEITSFLSIGAELAEQMRALNVQNLEEWQLPSVNGSPKSSRAHSRPLQEQR